MARRARPVQGRQGSVRKPKVLRSAVGTGVEAVVRQRFWYTCKWTGGVGGGLAQWQEQPGLSEPVSLC